MTDQQPKERVWAYVHGQLSAEDSAAMAEAVAGDRELTREIDAVRRLDKRFRQLLPLVDTSEADVEARVLTEWEADQAHGHPGGADVPRRTPLPGSPFGRRLIMSLLAVAACLVVGLGAYNCTTPSLVWDTSHVAAGATFRGPAGVERPPHDPDELAAAVGDVRRAIQERFDDAAPAREFWRRALGRRRFAVGLQVQPFADGSLVLRATAVDGLNPERLLHWDATFEGLDELRNAPRGFGVAVGDALAQCARANGTAARSNGAWGD